MCAESSPASSSSVSNGFTLGLFPIDLHSERFLTDRGVPCFKSQKLNLYYWVKRQKIATAPSSLMITPIIRKKAAEDDKENMQCHCRSIGLDVSEKSTKDLYGWEVR